MFDRDHHNRLAVLIEDHPPIADSKTRTRLSLEFLDVAVAGRRESIKLLADTVSRFAPQLESLPCYRRAEYGVPHGVNIAYCDIFVWPIYG